MLRRRHLKLCVCYFSKSVLTTICPKEHVLHIFFYHRHKICRYYLILFWKIDSVLKIRIIRIAFEQILFALYDFKPRYNEFICLMLFYSRREIPVALLLIALWLECLIQKAIRSSRTPQISFMWCTQCHFQARSLQQTTKWRQ